MGWPQIDYHMFMYIAPFSGEPLLNLKGTTS